MSGPSADSFAAQIAALAGRLRTSLEACPDGTATLWELRLKAKAPHSRVCLALGRLMAEGAVDISPEGLTYRVRGEPRKGSPPADSPGQILTGAQEPGPMSDPGAVRSAQ